MGCNLRVILSSLLAALLVSACGGGGGGSGNSQLVVTNSSNSSSSSSSSNSSSGVIDVTFRPALANSPYQSVLVDCVVFVNDKIKKECKLRELPFIGQKTAAPTKADILEHTVVSHPWMAERFAQALDQMPREIYQLFRGVTAIVIGADVRPSFYTPQTGAIYLDPNNLWLNDSERSTISKVEDYRSGFSNGLALRIPTRFVQGNADAWSYPSLTGSGVERSINGVIMPLADLLFHELAHANDFLPPMVVASADPNLTVAQLFNNNRPNIISSDLIKRLPLTSDMQFKLVGVVYGGATATPEQKKLQPAEAGLNFELDGANDIYNYFTQYEDAAMLFEETMMRYQYRTERDVAFTDAPQSANAYCDEYVVRWGVRNRIANPLVQARAKIVVQQLLGVSNVDKYFANIGTARSLNLGVDWCRSVVLVNGSNSEPKHEKISNQPMPQENLLPHY